MRVIRAVAVGALLAAILVTSAVAATRYVITSLSQIKPTVRTALRGAGYYAVEYSPARAGTASVSVQVPSGDYIATGGCTAWRSDPHGTPLTFGTAWSYLYTGRQLPVSADAATSVTNSGASLGSPFHDVPVVGSANLSDSTGLTLPRAGKITQTCKGDSGVYLGQLHLTAVAVGSLHGRTQGLGGPQAP
jgi:hypothetical protein